MSSPISPKRARSIARYRNFLLRSGALTGFFLFWGILAYGIASDVFPTPWAVFISLIDHWQNGDLLLHMSITLRRVALSFVIAMLFGTVIGIIMGRNRTVDTIFDDLLILLLNVPALVIIILCYIWMGLSETAAIAAVAINKIPLVTIIMREGAKAVDRELLQVAQVYNLSRWRTFIRTFAPQLIPYLLSASRSGLSLIWKIVLVVELIGRSDGVGFQLHVFFQFFDITSILAYTFAFIAIILSFEMLGLRPLEKALTRWRA